MKNLLLTLGVSVAALLAQGALAQTDSAGEARVPPSKPATAQQKSEARAQRQATGKELSKRDAGRIEDAPNPQDVARGNTKEDKAAAEAQRRAAGKAHASDAKNKHDSP